MMRIMQSDRLSVFVLAVLQNKSEFELNSELAR